ncbi:MAG: NrsF family protein, partial [Pseudomonadota bacterium]
WRYGVSELYGFGAPWPTRVGLRCLVLGVATGGLMLFAALMSWRRTEPVTPVATGAAFGAGAGLGSALLIDLWCPVSYLPHLLLGHVLPIVILAVVGGLVGGRVLGMLRGR